MARRNPTCSGSEWKLLAFTVWLAAGEKGCSYQENKKNALPAEKELSQNLVSKLSIWRDNDGQCIFLTAPQEWRVKK